MAALVVMAAVVVEAVVVGDAHNLLPTFQPLGDWERMLANYVLIMMVLLSFVSSFMLGYIYVDSPSSHRALAVCAAGMVVSCTAVIAMMDITFGRAGGAALICVACGLMEGWEDWRKARRR